MADHRLHDRAERGCTLERRSPAVAAAFALMVMASVLVWAEGAVAQGVRAEAGGDVQRREAWALQPEDPRMNAALDAARARGRQECPEEPGYIFRYQTHHGTAFYMKFRELTGLLVGRRGRFINESERNRIPNCGDGRTIDVDTLRIYLGPSEHWVSQIGCALSGHPPNPTHLDCIASRDPDNPRWQTAHEWIEWAYVWRNYFVRGLPAEVTLRPGANTNRLMQYRLSRLFAVPTALGNTAYVHALPAPEQQLPTGAVIYQIERGPGRAPLHVECPSAAWPNPAPAGTIGRLTGCSVTYELVPGLALQYRFLREIFDEPDWLSLDQRVRQRILSHIVDVPDGPAFPPFTP
jgi:hypothetical protein